MWQNLKHFFIPHHGNDHKPHLLRDTAVEAILGGILVLLVVSFAGRTLAPRIDFLAAVYPSILVDLANESRREYNLPPLVRSDLLTKAARAKAEHMIEEDYFEHISPSGVTPWYWFDRVGYAYTLAGENLAINFSDSGPINRAWMDSPAHRDNILGSGFREIGIAAVDGVIDGSKTTVVVQMFGTPVAASSNTTVAVAEESEPASSAVAGSVTENTDESAAGDDGEDDSSVAEIADASLVADEPTDEPESEGGDEPEHSSSVANRVASPTPPYVVYEEDSLMVASSGRATGTAVAQTTPQQTSRYSNIVERLIVNPSQAVTYVYLLLAVVLAAVLLATIAIEAQKQHPVNVAYGCFLLVILGSAMYVNETLLSAGFF